MLFALLYALFRRMIGSARPSTDRELEPDTTQAEHTALLHRYEEAGFY